MKQKIYCVEGDSSHVVEQESNQYLRPQQKCICCNMGFSRVEAFVFQISR